MKKRKLSDKELDSMLRAYCKRNVIAFEASERKNLMKSKILKTSVCIAVALIVLGAGIFVPKLISAHTATESETSVPKNYSIAFHASASSDETIVSGNSDFTYNVGDVFPSIEVGVADVDDTMCVSSDYATFGVRGKDVVSYDISCERGTLIYCDFDLKEKKLSGDTSISISDYYKSGNAIENILYNADEPRKSDAYWYHGNGLFDEIEDVLGIKVDYNVNTREELDAIRNYIEEHLNSAEDFTKYFGDTVTVTAHYSDGTAESATAEITLDYKYDSETNTRCGYYVVNYK